jgi:predicted kinase
LVRAKTTAVRLAQRDSDPDGSEVSAYLTLAERLATPNNRPLLVICHGLSGSGKTHVSDGLIARLPAIRIRSDIVRKQLHGMAELETSESAMNTGIYDVESSEKTYAQLAEAAGYGLRAGINVIVDATCLRHGDRECLLREADAANGVAVLLHCEANLATLAARIRARHARGADASEADVEVLHRQIASQEPLSSAEQNRTVSVDTTRKMDNEEVTSRIRALALSSDDIH